MNILFIEIIASEKNNGIFLKSANQFLYLGVAAAKEKIQ